ncbi:hypothetical protein M408DRAFT_164094 [Serendipita vermifera MAFF 305830]|uniref:Uncharacterized protein n=1 Tax=Serendipita vermifera MAFF 305830 TaxID=933852 RepID=A0A0C2WNC5_SERVB|nr:hypothetical protein M408DRAFT_164094 [Serendipita vermifera MAFF 305830]
MCRQVWKKSAGTFPGAICRNFGLIFHEDTACNQPSELGGQHEQLVVGVWLVLLRWICLVFIKDTGHLIVKMESSTRAKMVCGGSHKPTYGCPATHPPSISWRSGAPLNSILDISSKKGARNLGGMQQSDAEGAKTKGERRDWHIEIVRRSNPFWTCPLSNYFIQSSFDWSTG